MRDKELYQDCDIVIKRHLWRDNQSLFGDEVSPHLSQYIKEKEAILYSNEQGSAAASAALSSLGGGGSSSGAGGSGASSIGGTASSTTPRQYSLAQPSPLLAGHYYNGRLSYKDLDNVPGTDF